MTGSLLRPLYRGAARALSRWHATPRLPPTPQGRAARERLACSFRRSQRRLTTPSLELIGDLIDGGLDAGFVLFAAGSAGGARGANHLLADLDRQRAAPGGEPTEILRPHLRIFLQPFFHLARGNAESARGIGLLEAVLHRVRPGAVAADLDQNLAVAPHHGRRHAVAVRGAG